MVTTNRYLMYIQYKNRMGELFYICITVFLGLAQLFLVLFRSASKVRESVVEHRDHKKWIL